MPNFLKALVFEDNHKEIITRMARMLGKIAYKLSFFELHLKYKGEILGFYKSIINGKDDENMLAGIFNLPCMQQLYKAVCQPQYPPGTAITASTGITISAMHENDDLLDQEELKKEVNAFDIDFQGLYYKYANE